MFPCSPAHDLRVNMAQTPRATLPLVYGMRNDLIAFSTCIRVPRTPTSVFGKALGWCMEIATSSIRSVDLTIDLKFGLKQEQFGWSAAIFEWGTTYLMLWPGDGQLTKEDVKAVYDVCLLA